MDAVILAAGDGARLAGVMPTGFKPLLVVNGESMVVHVTKRVADGEPSNIVYVVSPTNAAPIIDVLSAGVPHLGGFMKFVVQPAPRGPIDALRLALPFVDSQWVCVACADNIIDEGLVERMMNIERGVEVVIPVVDMPYEDALRFTRIFEIDGVTHALEDYDAVQDYVGAWVGPLIFDTTALIGALTRKRPKTFAELLDGMSCQREISHCVDVGVPL